MGQLQSRLSLSVGTKILISVVLLVCLVILFLNSTAIRILFDDKRTFTLQNQSTEALLAARDFSNSARRGVDTLRIALGGVDPLRPTSVQGAQIERFNHFVDNQTELVAVTIALVNPLSGTVTQLVQHARTGALAENEIAEQDLAVPSGAIKDISQDLMTAGYGLFSLSRVGMAPLLGVAVADLGLKENPDGVPVAFGFIPLKGFAKDIRASELVIATYTGSVLFSTNPEIYFSKRTVADDPLFDAAVTSHVSSGTKEYTAGGDRFLGSYVLSSLNFVALTRTEWRRAMSAAYAMIEKLVLLGLMAVGLAIIFAILFSKSLVAPINRLYLATQQVAAGNFDLDLKVESRDEIGSLTESFVSMSRQITDLIQSQVRKAHLENELAIASTVQQTLFPPSKIDLPIVSIRSYYESASECGGDWWGFFGVGRKMCVMIADATGHGLPSALITASARSCFSVMHKLAQEENEFGFSPGAMLAYANRVIHDAAQGRIMMTFFIGVIDFEKGKIQYASAGHNPPWLFKKTGEKYLLRSMIANGQRLGEARDVPAFEEATIDVNEGDILFVYTDGLMEGKNRAGEMYGKKKVKRRVEAKIAEGPEATLDDLVADFHAYNEGKALDDDVTLAFLKILKIGPDAFVQVLQRTTDTEKKAVAEREIEADEAAAPA